jgi:MYXO-CTERM domain-containing protein
MQISYTVTTASTKGTGETIALTIQDLPTGVTGSFNPTSVTAGSGATLTLTAAAGAPLTGATPPTFMVIGKAPSALHAATAQVAVSSCVPKSCPQGSNCGTIDDGCGATVTCGPACTSPNSCGGGGMANVCGCTPTVTMCPNGANCGSVDNGCGMPVSCGPACTSPDTCGGGGMVNVCGCTPTTCAAQKAECGMIADGCGHMLACANQCTADQSCVANKCVANPPDMAVAVDMAMSAAGDMAMSAAGDMATSSTDMATASKDLGHAPDQGGGHGNGGGCGCRIAGESAPSSPIATFGIAALLLGALLRRRLLRA